MSQHWWKIHRVAINGLSKTEQAKFLLELAKKDTSLAKILARLNWDKLISSTVDSALKGVAEKNGLKVSKTFDNRGSDLKINGEIIGVLTDGEAQLGLVRREDGSIEMFENGYDRERRGDRLRQWKKGFETEYRLLVMKSALQILGCEVKEQVDDKGNVTLIGVKGKVSS
jgi:hypothetical protein